MSVKLPKLYRPIKIGFWSLRNGVGAGLGVTFDNDTYVERVCRRVLCPEGWKWQIKDAHKISEWDYCVEIDQNILDEIGMDADVNYTVKVKGVGSFYFDTVSKNLDNGGEIIRLSRNV